MTHHADGLTINELPAEGWRDDRGEVRVMAVIEGYVMARRPHCMPFVLPEQEFKKQFKPPDAKP